MTKRSQDPGTDQSGLMPSSSVELDASQLEQVAGGLFQCFPKSFSLDGKGNDVPTEEVQGISGPRTRSDGNP